MTNGRDFDILWTRVAAGDRTGFAALFDALSPDIYRFARRRVFDDDVAEDIVAETFLIVWRKRDDRPPADISVRAWAFGIAANLVRRHWRSSTRGQRALDRLGVTAEVGVSAHDPAIDVSTALDAAQDVRVMRIALGRLPRVMADLLVMRAWDEMEYSEIAHVLDCPIGTVRSRLARARARLESETESVRRELTGLGGDVRADASIAEGSAHSKRRSP